MDRDMSKIVSLLPGDVDLIEVNHGGKSVTVNGKVVKTDAEDDIFTYARNLRGSFSSVIISSMEVVEDEDGDIEGFEFEFLLE